MRKTALAAPGYVVIACGLTWPLVLSLGPDGVRPLYAAVYRTILGMAAIRAAARFNVLALCGIAVLSAVAVRTLETRRPRVSRAVIPLLGAVLILEYANGAIPFAAAPALTSNAGRWVRAQSGSGAVVCLPMDFDVGNTRCMLQSLEHGRPIVNGYSGFRPPFFAALVDAMRRMPSANSLRTLHEIGVEYVISDRPLVIDAPLHDLVIERVPASDQHVYQIVWSPAIGVAIAKEGSSPPPEPGPPPFAVGDSARYEVRWTDGPVNLPAGEVTLSVVPPRAGETFRFELSARTVPWVSRFFEADIYLETTATDRVLPLTHREVLTEGQRRQDRQLVFDAALHEVRMTTGGSSISLPLATAARDPMSALFYLRTLPLASGAQFTVPLSDNGRSSQLEVTVGGIETIMIDGQSRPAWKSNRDCVKGSNGRNHSESLRG